MVQADQMAQADPTAPEALKDLPVRLALVDRKDPAVLWELPDLQDLLVLWDPVALKALADQPVPSVLSAQVALAGLKVQVDQLAMEDLVVR